jgi:hypothetical protein
LGMAFQTQRNMMHFMVKLGTYQRCSQPCAAS